MPLFGLIYNVYIFALRPAQKDGLVSNLYLVEVAGLFNFVKFCCNDLLYFKNGSLGNTDLMQINAVGNTLR